MRLARMPSRSDMIENPPSRDPKRRRTGLIGLRTAAALAALVLATGCVERIVDARLNEVVVDPAAPDVDDHARAIHAALPIVDLHADSLLWGRDFLREHDYGHADLPRLVKGNVALQVIGIVTKTPRQGRAPLDAKLIEEVRASEEYRCISHDGLNFTAFLQVLQLRPVAAWFDLEARAFDQAGRLHAFVEESERRRAVDPDAPLLRLIRDADDLAALVEERRHDRRVVGVMLAVEGAHWVGGTPEEIEAAVERLFEQGFRMVAPTHRFQNALAAAGEGCDQLAGLTPEGATFLRHAERLGMVLDLAHASDRGIAEAAAVASGPLVVSHTGVRFDCPQEGDPKRRCVPARNMRAEEVRAVARTGGVVAIGYWDGAVGPGVQRIAAALRSTLAALAEPAFVAEMQARYGAYDPLDHVALGSDFDGAVAVPFDAAGLGILVAQLLQSGPAGEPPFDRAALGRIMGGNACRVIATRLPKGGPERARAICGRLWASAGLRAG
jgi:membrane dipeptidase